MRARNSILVSYARRTPWMFIVGPWLLVLLFWQLDLTYFSTASTTLVAILISTFVVPYVTVDLILSAYFRRSAKAAHTSRAQSLTQIDDMRRFGSRILWMFGGFIAIFVFEIGYFGYVPLLSMIGGADVSAFDFGVPGLHGFLFSLGAATATSSYLGYKCTHDTRYALLIAAVVAVFALVVTRKMLIFVFVQLTILEFLLSGSKKLLIGIFSAFVVVYVFGLLGDIRTGRDLILSLAQLKVDYPVWLPSGFIWIYIYVLTPMANYINFVELTTPTYSPIDLIRWIIPAGIMARITGTTVTDTFSNDWQISGAFNIASGLADMFTSYGHLGVVAFAGFVSMVTFFVRHKSSVASLLSLVVIYACLAMMLFNNNFTSLNVAFQFVLIYLLFRNRPERQALQPSPRAPMSSGSAI